jgi:hypothetical protein
VLVCIGTIAVPLCVTIRETRTLTKGDSREAASDWIAANLPVGARVAMETYSPYVDPKRYRVRVLRKMIDRPAGWYVQNGYTYLVFAGRMFARYYAEPERYAAQVTKYDALIRRFSTVRTFNDGSYEVRIHRLPDPAELRSEEAPPGAAGTL